MVWEGNQANAEGVEQLSVNVKINPLIWFAWGGFALLLFGSALAAWPKKRPELVAAAPVKTGGKSAPAKGRKK